jgi:hypothetical protein
MASEVTKYVVDWRAKHKHPQQQPRTVGPTSPSWPNPGPWQPYVVTCDQKTLEGIHRVRDQ